MHICYRVPLLYEAKLGTKERKNFRSLKDLFMQNIFHVQAREEKETMEMKAAFESKGDVDFRVCSLDLDVSTKMNKT